MNHIVFADETPHRGSLLKPLRDGLYAGLHLLPDGTIVATSRTSDRRENIGCSIVSVRFKMSEVDGRAARTTE